MLNNLSNNKQTFPETTKYSCKHPYLKPFKTALNICLVVVDLFVYCAFDVFTSGPYMIIEAIISTRAYTKNIMY